MFDLTDNGLFLGSLPQRKQPPANLSTVPVADVVYQAFLTRCATSEITADIILFGLEDAQKENACLRAHFPAVADLYWMTGRSGQGMSGLSARLQGLCYFMTMIRVNTLLRALLIWLYVLEAFCNWLRFSGNWSNF